MDDALFVSRSQALGYLHPVLEGLAQRKRAMAQPLAQAFAFEQFRDEVRHALVCADVEHDQDVGVVQGAGGPGFLLEAPQAIGIGREAVGQDLDRDLAAEARIARAVDLAHPSGAKRRQDFIRPDDPSAGGIVRLAAPISASPRQRRASRGREGSRRSRRLRQAPGGRW